MRQMVDLMVRECEAVFARITHRSELARGDFGSSLQYAQRVVDLIDQQIVAMPGWTPSWVAALLRFGLRRSQAEVAESAALLAREERRWADAVSSYRLARNHLQAAARLALDLPGSGTLIQEHLLMQAAALDANMSQCLAEHAMWRENATLRDELADLRRAVLDGVRGAGVTVMTSAEATSSIEETNVVINQLERSVRNTLADLQSQLDAVDLDSESHASLETSLKDLIETRETGSRFFAKAREVARNLAATVQSLGESAAQTALRQLTDSLLRQIGLTP
jgi:hypothetical protein